METAAKSSVRLTLPCIRQSVDSYPLSLKFMKQFVPSSVSSILHERFNDELGSFRRLHCGGAEYHLIKSTAESKTFKYMFDGLVGALEAIEHQYLKELHLVMTEKGTEKVLERYKYKFYYNKNGETPEETKKMKKTIYKSVKNHFIDIKRLSKLPKLSGINTICYMLLTYYEDVTPFDYQPPFFKDCLENMFILNQMKSESRVLIEKISTGYHSVICSAKLEVPAIANKENNEQNKKKSDTFCETISIPSDEGIDESLLDSSTANETINFKCICGVLEDVEGEERVVCSRCKAIFHHTCVSMYLQNLPSNYVCIECADNYMENGGNNENLFSLNEEQRSTYSIRFLLLSVIERTNKFPLDLFNKISIERRKAFIYFLKEQDLVSKKGSFDFNLEAIKKYLEKCKNILKDDEELANHDEPPLKKSKLTK